MQIHFGRLIMPPQTRPMAQDPERLEFVAMGEQNKENPVSYVISGSAWQADADVWERPITSKNFTYVQMERPRGRFDPEDEDHYTEAVITRRNPSGQSDILVCNYPLGEEHAVKARNHTKFSLTLGRDGKPENMPKNLPAALKTRIEDALEIDQQVQRRLQANA